MNIDYSKIGTRIRANRMHHKMSQETLAYLVKIEPSYLSRVENGKQHPSLDLLLKLSNTLDVTLNELLIDNQIESARLAQRELELLLDGCDAYERKIIVQTAAAMKEILHGTKRLR